ncbi:superoxide reductase [Geothermobacter ehrlichii]|uniref:Desulfoferrodoxin n=1 Tax=Geothermobacter ehrlichii TaxID=213224 RepID=A0A5D3WJW3_9BACT|nr:desulfoferrodoxin [Geothermobacter ehrlichii]TYO97112.1 superoxide reductase [Geothermobacter ehrlichii]
MAKQLEVYKCELCSNIVEVLHSGAGSMFCCGQPMTMQTENTVDAAKEKHVPVIEVGADSITVRVGSVAHPMLDDHYIVWIELLADGKAYRQYLKPGDAPEATFPVSADKVTAREYCNLHGHWSSKA